MAWRLLFAHGMPEGTRHELTGTLHAARSELVLRLTDGREWSIVAPAGLDRFIDRRVKVSGVRGQANVLHVERFSAVEM